MVVDEPGACKSGALHDVMDELLSAGRDILFFAVDRVQAQTVQALRRELRLDHELLDVLANWPGAEPGVLVVDALDAARSEQAAQMLRELIARVPSAAPPPARAGFDSGSSTCVTASASSNSFEARPRRGLRIPSSRACVMSTSHG